MKGPFKGAVVWKSQLDENIPLGHLERALSYFESLYAVHLSGELRDDGQLLADGLRCLGLACEAVQCALGWVRRLLSSDAGDLAALLDAALASAAEALQGTRRLRRRLPTDDAPVALSGPAREQLEANVRSLGQVLQAACSLQRAVAARAEQDAPLPADKLKELAHEATDRVYGKEDQGPDCLRDALAGVAASLDSIGDALQPLKDAPPKPPAPLHLRAQASRQQARDLQALRAKLEAREADIVALKTALKIKVCFLAVPLKSGGRKAHTGYGNPVCIALFLLSSSLTKHHTDPKWRVDGRLSR